MRERVHKSLQPLSSIGEIHSTRRKNDRAEGLAHLNNKPCSTIAVAQSRVTPFPSPKGYDAVTSLVETSSIQLWKLEFAEMQRDPLDIDMRTRKAL